ncbi:MAG: M28 family peptidase [Planctomycetes bacterium]|nr:M28 family peptidase [Planctomycetota bacterium]
MHRPLRQLVLSGLAALAACGGASGPIDGSRAMAHVEKFVGFGPRPFGSEALAKQADYICAELQKLGLSPKRHEVLEEKEKKTIRNVYVQIDGDDPENGPILMFGAHYDTKLADGHQDAAHNFRFVGAIDGGGAPAVLLELARELKNRPQKPKVNVWFYFIDAEESLDWQWNDARALLGSRAFCRFLSKEKILPRVKAFVLLDLIGSKNWKIDRDGNSHQELQNVFGKAAKTMGEERRVYAYPTEQELDYYRSKNVPWGTTDDHQVFRDFGVPSVLLIDFHLRQPEGQKHDDYERWWHTPDDDLPAMDPRALAFAGNLVLAALPDLQDFVLARAAKK